MFVDSHQHACIFGDSISFGTCSAMHLNLDMINVAVVVTKVSNSYVQQRSKVGDGI